MKLHKRLPKVKLLKITNYMHPTKECSIVFIKRNRKYNKLTRKRSVPWGNAFKPKARSCID